MTSTKSSILKNVVTVLLFSVFSISSTIGQDLKGKMLVGGNLNLSGRTYSGSLRDSENFNFSIRPNFGGFVSNSVAMGAVFSYNYYNNKSESELSQSNSHNVRNEFGFAYFLRYYKFFGKKFSILLAVTAGGSRGVEDYSYVTNSSDIRSKNIIQTASVSFRPGIVYFISPKFGVETSFGNIGWNLQRVNDELSSTGNGSTESNYILDFGLSSLQFGFNYYFGKGKTKETPEQ